MGILRRLQKFQVDLVNYVLGMHILYESACIIGYCTCWVVRQWFVYIVVLQKCVDFGEVVSCVHYANASNFITWFDDNRLVIFEVV